MNSSKYTYTSSGRSNPIPPEKITLFAGYHSEFLSLGIRERIEFHPFAPPHLCVCGSSGSGKSFLEAQLLARLADHKEYELIFSDFKGIDFPYLLGCPGYYPHMEVGTALDYVTAEMDRRMSNPLPYYHPIFCVFDEWSGYLNLLDRKGQDEAKKKLSALLMLSRTASICIILVMQRMDASNFGSSRDNIGHIICLGSLSEEAKRMISPDHKDMLLPQGRGKGYLVSDGRPPSPLTVPNIRDPERIQNTLKRALSRRER